MGEGQQERAMTQQAAGWAGARGGRGQRTGQEKPGRGDGADRPREGRTRGINPRGQVRRGRRDAVSSGQHPQAPGPRCTAAAPAHLGPSQEPSLWKGPWGQHWLGPGSRVAAETALGPALRTACPSGGRTERPSSRPRSMGPWAQGLCQILGLRF